MKLNAVSENKFQHLKAHENTEKRLEVQAWVVI